MQYRGVKVVARNGIQPTREDLYNAWKDLQNLNATDFSDYKVRTRGNLWRVINNNGQQRIEIFGREAAEEEEYKKERRIRKERSFIPGICLSTTIPRFAKFWRPFYLIPELPTEGNISIRSYYSWGSQVARVEDSTFALDPGGKWDNFVPLQIYGLINQSYNSEEDAYYHGDLITDSGDDHMHMAYTEGTYDEYEIAFGTLPYIENGYPPPGYTWPYEWWHLAGPWNREQHYDNVRLEIYDLADRAVGSIIAVTEDPPYWTDDIHADYNFEYVSLGVNVGSVFIVCTQSGSVSSRYYRDVYEPKGDGFYLGYVKDSCEDELLLSRYILPMTIYDYIIEDNDPERGWTPSVQGGAGGACQTYIEEFGVNGDGTYYDSNNSVDVYPIIWSDTPFLEVATIFGLDINGVFAEIDRSNNYWTRFRCTDLRIVNYIGHPVYLYAYVCYTVDPDDSDIETPLYTSYGYVMDNAETIVKSAQYEPLGLLSDDGNLSHAHDVSGSSTREIPEYGIGLCAGFMGERIFEEFA